MNNQQEDNKQQSTDTSSENSQQNESNHQMATNPNPRANENLTSAPFDKEPPSEQQVGSEITDGEAG